MNLSSVIQILKNLCEITQQKSDTNGFETISVSKQEVHVSEYVVIFTETPAEMLTSSLLLSDASVCITTHTVGNKMI